MNDIKWPTTENVNKAIPTTDEDRQVWQMTLIKERIADLRLDVQKLNESLAQLAELGVKVEMDRDYLETIGKPVERLILTPNFSLPVT